MTISRFAMIAFFLIVGISAFVSFQYAGLLEGIAALVTAIALIAGK